MSTAFRLGVFIVGTILILSAGIFLIGGKEFLFSSTYSLRADFKNVGGLADGAQVRVGGIPEGTVKHIALPKRPGDQVTVEMNLQHATQNVLKKDSVATIKSEGLLGDKYVEISFGSDQAGRLKNGDTIPSAPPIEKIVLAIWLSRQLASFRANVPLSTLSPRSSSATSADLGGIAAEIAAASSAMRVLASRARLSANSQISSPRNPSLRPMSSNRSR